MQFSITYLRQASSPLDGVGDVSCFYSGFGCVGDSSPCKSGEEDGEEGR